MPDTDIRERPVLEVNDLHVEYATPAGSVKALQGVSFRLMPGETLAIVGESGCGKSTLARALVGLLQPPGHVLSGSIRLNGEEFETTFSGLNPMRGRVATLVLQDPRDSLNPVLTIRAQLNMVLAHHGIRRNKRSDYSIRLLRRVHLADPKRVLSSYPFQLSGGMCQRVALAIALAGDPQVLIADEPTTALDVQVQAGILRLMHELQRERRFSLILISHDLGVVAGACEKVLVLYAGRLVEYGPTEDVLTHPKHPYTAALIGCLPIPGRGLPQALPGLAPNLIEPPDRCPFIPRCEFADDVCRTNTHPDVEQIDSRQVACYHPVQRAEVVPSGSTLDPSSIQPGRSLEFDEPVLEAIDLRKRYRVGGLIRGTTVDALRKVSLKVIHGETVGLVGETGCGKSTLARCLLVLDRPEEGTVSLDGINLTDVDGRTLRSLRRRAQPVFQDARACLNPGRRIVDIVQEPLRYFRIGTKSQRRNRARAQLRSVGISDELHMSKPRALSTGQCQKVAIARALVTNPDFLVCDEPLSSLDLSAQAQVIALLSDLQKENGFGMLFISHDLAVILTICDRVVVMLEGRVMESSAAADIGSQPAHPYTRALLQSIPGVVTDGQEMETTKSNGLDRPANGCPFAGACPLTIERCWTETPELHDLTPGHSIACHRSAELQPTSVVWNTGAAI